MQSDNTTALRDMVASLLYENRLLIDQNKQLLNDNKELLNDYKQLEKKVIDSDNCVWHCKKCQKPFSCEQ